MITFLAIIHVLACLVLVGLVLIQDSKGGGVFSGQTSSNSFLGPSGATTLAGNATKIIAGILAITCILIAKFTADSKKSIVDSGLMNGGTATSQPAIPAATAESKPVEAQPAAATSPSTATSTSPSAAPAAPAEKK